VNVYGLKEDILDHLAGDVTEFSVQMQRMRVKLRALIDQCNCYYVSCDGTDHRNIAVVYDLFASKGSLLIPLVVWAAVSYETTRQVPFIPCPRFLTIDLNGSLKISGLL